MNVQKKMANALQGQSARIKEYYALKAKLKNMDPTGFDAWILKNRIQNLEYTLFAKKKPMY